MMLCKLLLERAFFIQRFRQALFATRTCSPLLYASILYGPGL